MNESLANKQRQKKGRGGEPSTMLRKTRLSELLMIDFGVVNASALRLLVARERKRVLSLPSSRFMTTMLPERI